MRYKGSCLYLFQRYGHPLKANKKTLAKVRDTR